MTSDTLIVFRTHLWDEGVDFCARCLQRSTSARIVVAADETNGPVPVPAEFEKIAHTVDTFPAMGLPLLPTRKNALWHCGDYPFYQIAQKVKSEYYLMIEGDLGITGPLDSLLKKMIADKVDCASCHFRSEERWQNRRGAVSRRVFFPDDDPTAQVMTGLYAAVFLSRRIIETMLSERQRMAKVAAGPFGWYHCEEFTPIVAQKAKGNLASFDTYADTSHVSWLRPIAPDTVTELEDDTVHISHPVLFSPKWEKKQIQYLEHENDTLLKSVQRLRKRRAELEKELRACRKG